MAATMEDYDPLHDPLQPITYPPSAIPFSDNGMPFDYPGNFLPADTQDSFSNFGSELSADEAFFAPSTSLRHPLLQRHASSGFESQYAPDTTQSFDYLQNPENTTMDRSHGALLFSMPYPSAELHTDGHHQIFVDISAHLQGNFYLGEPQWSGSPDTPPPPLELTCYRRNLFSIEGQVKVPRALRYVWFNEPGYRVAIMDLELQVSAIESVEQNPTKLISVPFKGPPAGGEGPQVDDKTEKEPANIALDPTSGSDFDGDHSMVPFHWKRLQFRSATQNNGRRKELQQHFILKLKVWATLATGQKISLTESHSQAIIVRGRSPRNFASRNDVPLTSGSASRRNIPALPRASNSHNSVPRVTSAPRPMNSSLDELPMPLPQYQNNELPTPPQDFYQPSQIMMPDSTPTTSYQDQMASPAFLFGHENSPDFPPPFSFSPSIPPQPSTGPQSLYFDSDNEGSPVPQNSRPGSRPPTSNPSPSITSQPRSQSLINTASPPLMHDSAPSSKRPRQLSHQASASSTQQLPVGPVSATSVPPALTRGISSAPYTPYTEPDLVSNYVYIPVPPDDFQQPVNAIYAPHTDSHHAPWTTVGAGGNGDMALGPLGSRKRYFA